MLKPSKVRVENKNTQKSIRPIFKTKDFCLYQQDALAVRATFPSNDINMVFADPPYMLSDNGITCHAGKMVSVNKGRWDKSSGFEKDVAFHERWIAECKRILKPEGTMWISGTLHSIYQCGYLVQKLGFHILNDICWFKPNAAPNLACTTFAHIHETLLWAKKEKQQKHAFQYAAMKDGDFAEDKIKTPGRQMRSVWSIPTPAQKEKTFGKHPTQKPLALLKRIVLCFNQRQRYCPTILLTGVGQRGLLVNTLEIESILGLRLMRITLI